LWLGQLYLVQGSAPEAEFVNRQGLELAQKMGAHSFILEFNMKLSELNQRRRKLEMSSEILDTVGSYPEEVS
jgi:hypothetical protein